jgi:hypothetical protein
MGSLGPPPADRIVTSQTIVLTAAPDREVIYSPFI